MKRSIKAISVSDQLKVLKLWHDAIGERRKPSSGTSRENLVDQWEILEAADPNIAANSSFILRGRTFENRPPLAEFFSYLEAGFYPPPELLLTLLGAWTAYREAGNNPQLEKGAATLSLEEAFFGKPVPKAGNYAARAMRVRKELGMRIRLGSEMSKPMSKADAAIALSGEFSPVWTEDSIKKLAPIKPE